jgi:hypothetical protein
VTSCGFRGLVKDFALTAAVLENKQNQSSYWLKVKNNKPDLEK